MAENPCEKIAAFAALRSGEELPGGSVLEDAPIGEEGDAVRDEECPRTRIRTPGRGICGICGLSVPRLGAIFRKFRIFRGPLRA